MMAKDRTEYLKAYRVANKERRQQIKEVIKHSLEIFLKDYKNGR